MAKGMAENLANRKVFNQFSQSEPSRVTNAKPVSISGMLKWGLVIFFSVVSLLLMGWFSPAYAGADHATARATFAGGCFWCMEHPFDELPGVIETTSGYTGGSVENPSYNQVSSGTTGHLESVQVEYDPGQISYEDLLNVYWRNVDPVDGGGQFCDRGSQYRPAIFYHDISQQQQAEASVQALDSSGILDLPIAAELIAASEFYPAEDYHQNYYQTHPVRYKVYRYACGRDQRLEEVWGDESGAELSE